MAFDIEYPDVAPGKTATQSSTRSGGDAKFALDGNLDDTASATERNTGPQWWRVHLGEEYFIQRITFHIFGTKNKEGGYSKY